MSKGLYGRMTVWGMLVLLLFLLTGCGNAESRKLSIYVVEDEKMYQSVLKDLESNPEMSEYEISVTSYASYAEMEEQLNAELMSGKGPDLILFNSFYSALDPYKLVDGNMLLSLDEMVEKLNLDEYETTLLDAGKVKGSQYFLPLSWNIVQAYTSKSVKDSKKLSSDLAESLVQESEKLADTWEYSPGAASLGRADITSVFLETAGVKVFDEETGELSASREEIWEIAELAKVFFDNREKGTDIIRKYRSDFAGAASHYTYFLENDSFLNNIRYYQSLYRKYLDDEMYFSAFAHRDGGVTAQIVQYAAINANSKNPQGAWDAAKCMLDAPVGNLSYSKYDTANMYYASLKKSVYEDAVKQLGSSTGAGPDGGLDFLSTDNMQMMREIPKRVKEAVIPNTVFGNMIQECMNPYFLEEESFDTCYEDLIKRTQLYLGE